MVGDEHEIDQHFQEAFNDPPLYVPPEASVENMFHRLESVRPLGPFGLPRWVYTAAAVIPLFLGIGYLILQLDRAHDRIDMLSQAYSETKTTQQIHFTDTIKRTVIAYDTILRVQYIQKKVYVDTLIIQPNYASAPLFGNPPSTSGPFTSPSYWPNPIFRSDALISQDSNKPRNRRWMEGESQEELGQQQEPYAYEAPPRGIFPIEYPFFDAFQGLDQLEPSDSILADQYIAPLKKRFGPKHLVYAMTPKKLRVGAYGPSLSFLPGSSGAVALGGEIKGEFWYSDHVRLNLGARYLHSNIEEKDAITIANLPPASPRNPEDVIKEVYIEGDFVEIPIGIKYVILPDRTWQPYVEAAWVMRKGFNQKLRYEYIGNNEEYVVPVNVEADPFSFGQGQLGAGVSYILHPKWSLEANGYYVFNLNTNASSFQNLNRPVLQLGASYGF